MGEMDRLKNLSLNRYFSDDALTKLINGEILNPDDGDYIKLEFVDQIINTENKKCLQVTHYGSNWGGYRITQFISINDFIDLENGSEVESKILTTMPNTEDEESFAKIKKDTNVIKIYANENDFFYDWYNEIILIISEKNLILIKEKMSAN